MNTTQILEFLWMLDAALTQPFLESLRDVIVLTVGNLVFYMVLRVLYGQTFGSKDQAFLPVLSFFVSIFHLKICSTNNMIKYTLTMSMVFTTIYECSLLMKLWITRTKLYHFTKATAIIMGAFRCLDDSDDFLTFFNMYILMSFKLMCAAHDAQNRTFEELNQFGDGKIASWTEVFGYMLYTGYTPYRDYLALRNREPQRNERWFKMMASSASRAVIYKIFSWKYLPKEVLGDTYLHKYVLFFIRAFQFRCQYYYWLQLRELEAVAVGIKRGGWVKHTAFDFKAAEFSVRIIDFLIAFNLPLSSSLRNHFRGEIGQDQEHIIFHAFITLLVIATYHPLYTVVVLLLMIACKGVGCRHTWTRHHISFQLLRCFFITFNQMRLSLLWCNIPGWTPYLAMICASVAIMMDVLTQAITNCIGLNEPLPPPRRRARGSRASRRRNVR